MLAGFEHPFSGVDHLLAMVAVGLWAAQIGGKALWAAPLAFFGAMLAGGALGHAGLALPGVEPMILASVLLLGLAVDLVVRPPLALALAGIALFGLAHGHAHGTEGQGASLMAHAGGFAVATVALHGVGLTLGLGLARFDRARRLMGGLTAAAGIALAVAG